jgi:NAD-dependent dihydropyrimidine dehydrogenase PreA subunit
VLGSRFRGNDDQSWLVALGSGAAMKVRIDYAICNSCGLCREICPESAIRPALLEPRHLYEVQPAKCTGCGECLGYCPAPGALVEYADISLAPLAGRGSG